jgi:hypothetical protein
MLSWDAAQIEILWTETRLSLSRVDVAGGASFGFVSNADDLNERTG